MKILDSSGPRAFKEFCRNCYYENNTLQQIVFKLKELTDFVAVSAHVSDCFFRLCSLSRRIDLPVPALKVFLFFGINQDFSLVG